MARGQAEALMPLLERLLAQAGCVWGDLAALGVGVGPGNFTGTRISVAAARGLSLAIGVPAIGVSAFELVRDPPGPGAHPAEIVSLPAPRDGAYVQPFGHGAPRGAPRLIDPAAPPADLRLPAGHARLPAAMRVTGHRAAEIARPFGAAYEERALEDIAARLGRITAWKWRNGQEGPRPAPLYVRPADAAPPADPPPRILP